MVYERHLRSWHETKSLEIERANSSRRRATRGLHALDVPDSWGLRVAPVG